MKFGRLILTHREDLINQLKDFYLGGKRTEFLVIACDATKVDTKKFSQNDTFHIVPFLFPGMDGATMTGRQWRVWIEIAKNFPEIDSWVIHDYDFVAKPNDSEILSHLAPNEYAMIGAAFPVWRKGMGYTKIDTYPFPQSHRYWHQNLTLDDTLVNNTLNSAFPVTFQGIKTVVGGFSDFIATSKTNILFLDDPKVNNPKLEGVEQIPHTIWRAMGVRPVDMRNFYKMKVLMDVKYIPFSDEYDMLNPVKFWPGKSIPALRERMKNFEYAFKTLIKKLIRYRGWRW